MSLCVRTGRWNASLVRRPYDEQTVRDLSDHGMHPVVARVLAARVSGDPERIVQPPITALDRPDGLLDETGKKEAASEIATLESQIKSPNPKQSILRESLGSVRRILEGAAGNLVASGLLNQIGVLFGV